MTLMSTLAWPPPPRTTTGLPWRTGDSRTSESLIEAASRSHGRDATPSGSCLPAGVARALKRQLRWVPVGQDGSRSIGSQPPAQLQHLPLGEPPDLPVGARGVDQQPTARPSPQRDRDRRHDAWQEPQADPRPAVLDVPERAFDELDHHLPRVVRGSVRQVVVEVAGEDPPVPLGPDTPLGGALPAP